MKKRVLSMLLAIVMVLGLMPNLGLVAQAVEETSEPALSVTLSIGTAYTNTTTDFYRGDNGTMYCTFTFPGGVPAGRMHMYVNGEKKSSASFNVTADSSKTTFQKDRSTGTNLKNGANVVQFEFVPDGTTESYFTNEITVTFHKIDATRVAKHLSGDVDTTVDYDGTPKTVAITSLYEEGANTLYLAPNQYTVTYWQGDQQIAAPTQPGVYDVKITVPENDYYAQITNHKLCTLTIEGTVESPVAPHVASVTASGVTTNYADIASAVAAAKASEGSTLKLLDNITTDTATTIDSGSFTIDLNGQTWQCSDRVLNIYGTADIKITDTSVSSTGKLLGTSNAQTIQLYGDANLEITGGTVENNFYTDAIAMDKFGRPSQATLTVSGGTFITNGITAISAYGKSVTVTGGTISSSYGDKRDIDYQNGEIDLSKHSNPTGIRIYIYSQFSGPYVIQLPGGYVLQDEDGNAETNPEGGQIYTVGTAPVNHVASVTTAGGVTTNYADIALAVTAAKDSSGSTLKLLDNIITDTAVTIDSGSFAIDLNGQTWKSSNRVLNICGTADIKITDTSVGSTGKLLGTSNSHSTIQLYDSAQLEVAGGTVENPYDQTISMSESGKLTSAALIISGGMVKGSNIVINASGAQVTVTGGTISSSYGNKRDIYYKNGVIDLSKHSNPTGIRIFIDSGFSGPYVIDLPDGYVLQDEDGNAVTNLVCDQIYTVGKLPEPVASVTTAGGVTTNYTDIAAAIAAAQESAGSTLKLLVDITTDTATTINSGSFAIDLNGQTWQRSGYLMNVLNNANITIIDSSTEESGKLRGTGNAPTIMLCDSANLEIKSGTVENVATSTAIDTSSGGSQTEATLIVSGGTVMVPEASTDSAISAYGKLVSVTGGKIKGGYWYDIYYQTGTVDLSGHSDPTGIRIHLSWNFDGTPDILLPDGYVLLDSTGNAATTLETEETYTVGKATHSVKIKAVDAIDNWELAGAHLQILNAEGDVVVVNGGKVEWDSTEAVYTATGLETGVEYTLRATVAPAGYVIPNDITFTIDQAGDITPSGTVTNGVILVKFEETAVEIKAVNKAGDAALAGAQLQILEKVDGKEVVRAEWENSTEDVWTVTGLKTGVEHILRAIDAPDGYTVPADTTFTLNYDGKVSGGTTKTKDGVLLVEFEVATPEITSVDFNRDSEAYDAATNTFRYDEEHSLEVTIKGRNLQGQRLYIAFWNSGNTHVAGLAEATHDTENTVLFRASFLDQVLDLSAESGKPADIVMLHAFLRDVDGPAKYLNLNVVPNTRTVTFVDHDGTELKSETVNYGASATAPADPTREGYTFTGWDQAFDNVTSDLTVTAQYKINQYSIIYMIDGTTEHTRITLDYGADVIAVISNPIREGYTFTGWSQPMPTTMPAHDVIITGSFRVNKYPVTFMAGEGAFADDVKEMIFECDFGTTPVAPETPTLAGYSFAGWAPALASVGVNGATYTATYTADDVNYTVETYIMDTNGNYGAPVTETKTAKTDSEVSVMPEAMTGFTLDTGASVLEGVAAADGSTILKVYYIRNQYDFTVVVDGIEETGTYYYEEAITAPADPTKIGYTFAGWDVEIPANMPAENVTITAKWTINQYTITFDTDGGTAVAPITQNYGTAVAAPTAPTKIGYTFAGWDVEVPANMPAENMTIKAKWTVNQYTITFDTDGGTAIDPIKQDYNTAVTAPVAPTKTGYTFAGWDKTIPATMPAEDMIITATWTVNDYTVSFDANGGSEIEPITVTYGEKYGNLPSSAITGLSGGNKNWYLVDKNGNVTDTNIKNLTKVETARDHTLFMTRGVLAPALKITLEVPGAISDGYQYYVPGNSTRILTVTVNNENKDVLDYTYQWYKDGVAIDGATEAVLTLAGNVSDSGTYQVVVTATLKADSDIVVTANSASAEKEQIVKILHATNTLSYDANGGKNAPGSHYTGGATITVSKDQPSRVAYTFDGWNTRADGSGSSYDSGRTYTFANDNGNGGCTDTLYAQWEAITYDVTVDADDGNVSVDNPNPTMGDKVTITVDPDPGKRVDDVVVKDKDGNPIEVTKNPDGTYTYEQPIGEVTIEVTFEDIPTDPTYKPTIKDTVGGDTTVSDKNPERGDKVTITTDPDKGFEVGKITVTDNKGNPVKITDNGDGTFTYVQPAGKVTITVIYVPERADFVDVSTASYYYSAINWAVANGITNGTSATTFSPNAICTRAQVVTFLWRAAGEPAPRSDKMSFTDVAKGAYYYDAVLWAVENGITNGISENEFAPNAIVTRGQTVTFLWRAKHGFEMDGKHGFHDVHEDAYYHDAVLWAVENDITNGTSKTTFSPDNGCTRGQIVTFLYRCMAK